MTPREKMREYLCADCGWAIATHFLPEGRYLCGACWRKLRDLRAHVIAGSQRKARA